MLLSEKFCKSHNFEKSLILADLYLISDEFSSCSPWSTVNTPCNTSCGGGVMMKVRSCTNPRPQGKDGKDCEGIDKQYFPCNEKPCDMQVGVLADVLQYSNFLLH